jgi:ABC-type phosphate transport system substrate-binding protein
LDARSLAQPGVELPTVLVVDEALALGMLAGGSVAAAVVHRRVTPEEARDASSGGLTAEGRFEHMLLARDSIALAVHPTNPLAAVTRAQARGLLTGKITWDDLPRPAPSSGGPVLKAPEGPAHVYLRGVGHSSLRGLAVLRVREATRDAVRLGSDEAVIDRLAGDPQGLALVPAAILIGGMGTARGKALGLGEPDGGAVVLPGAGTRGGAIWPLLRPLYLVRPAWPGTAAAGLLEFAHSLPGKRIAMDRGFLPASPISPRSPRRSDE